MKKLLFLLLFATSASAQDRWLTIERFSGLDLYQDDVSLPVGGALEAENIQFRNPGTISALEGMAVLDTLCAGAFPIIGMGGMREFAGDSSRFVVACSTIYWNSHKSDLTTFVKGGCEPTGLWQRWTDSTRVQSTQDSGRIAEVARAGWLVRHADNTWDTIDYISDNNTFFLNNVPAASHAGQYYTGTIIPQLAGGSEPVSFVPVDIEGTTMVVGLQAGSEPVIYNGATNGGWRYFGIADSGHVTHLRFTGTDSIFYISDNSKILRYGNNELYVNGYWLHLPYGFGDSDSSHWGRMFPIDSNRVVKSGDTAEFRIYFRPGNSFGERPGGAWADSMAGTQYLLVSAPFTRTVYSQAQTPTARFEDGGRYIHLPTGTVSAREFDHTANWVITPTDTFSVTHPTVLVYCAAGTRGGYICDTFLVEEGGRNAGAAIPNLYRILGSNLPIRTSFVDTNASPDSIIIWTSGYNPSSTFADFTSSDWSIVRTTIPYASCGIVYKDRLYLAGDPQDPNFIAYSEPFQFGAFPRGNALSLGGSGDEVVAFGLMYGWLVVFQREHTWLLKDDPDLGGTLELALPDEGCIAPPSVYNIGNLEVYLSHKGWRIFDGNNARDFAQPIKPSVQGFPRVSYPVNQAYKRKSAVGFDASTGNLLFSMPFNADTANSGSFLWNNVDGSFSYSDEVYGGLSLSLTYLDTLRLFFSDPSAAVLYSYGYTDSTQPIGVDQDSMRCRWTSGWMDFGAPEVRKTWDLGYLSGNYGVLSTTPTNKLIVDFFRDNDTVPFLSDTATLGTIISNKYYEARYNMTFSPPADGSDFQFLQVRVTAYGYTVFQPRRLGIRYDLDLSVPPYDGDVQFVRP